MSFDVFFQGFIAGESSGHGGSAMRAVLAPHVVERNGSFLSAALEDGEADIYLEDDHMMASHIFGRATGTSCSTEPGRRTG